MSLASWHAASSISNLCTFYGTASNFLMIIWWSHLQCKKQNPNKSHLRNPSIFSCASFILELPTFFGCCRSHWWKMQMQKILLYGNQTGTRYVQRLTWTRLFPMDSRSVSWFHSTILVGRGCLIGVVNGFHWRICRSHMVSDLTIFM